jgi:hypothetical protein
MSNSDPNLPHLRCIAQALGHLREQVVFVGGAVAGLLITDPAAEKVRATRDVDAVVNTSRGNFHRIEKQLALQGFAPDSSSEVICRWIHRDSGLQFDLMPVETEVIGFSNRWYPYAAETAVLVDLGEGIVVRLVSAAAFVATKLEAFADRGSGDFLFSHDLEDVLNIVDGREELAAELAASPTELRQSVADALAALCAQPGFLNALPGLLTDSGRAALVLARLKRMSV